MISADHYKARPDLVNCGRTLFGNLPTRHQQGDLSLDRKRISGCGPCGSNCGVCK